jgi:WD40 repeat protein
VRRRQLVVLVSVGVALGVLTTAVFLLRNYLAPRERHAGEVRALAFAGDGARLLSGGEDGLKLWEIGSLERRFGLTRSVRRIAATPPGIWSGFWAVAFSPDARTAASITGLGRVEVWDLETGSRLRMLVDRNKESGGRFVAFSPDGVLVAAVGEDLRVYELGGVETYHAAEVDGPVAFVESRTLAAVEIVRSPAQNHATLVRLEMQGGLRSPCFDDRIWRIEAVSTNPLRAIAHDGCDVSIRDEHGARLASFTMDTEAGNFAISRDGSVVALAQFFSDWTHKPIPPIRPFGGTHVACLLTGRVQCIPEIWPDEVSALALSHDGSLLAVGTKSGRVLLFDTTPLRDP